MKIFKKIEPFNIKIMRKKGFHKTINKDTLNVIKFVSKKSGWKKLSSCPVCKSKLLSEWIEKFSLKIKVCRNCSHAFCVSVPVNISEAYENNVQEKSYRGLYEAKREYKIKRFARERVKLLRKFDKKNSLLLDYGCGSGWFIEHAKKFYRCEGYEPTTYMADLVQENLNIRMHTDATKLPKNSYDIITLFDVIEHVEDVRGMRKKLYSMLKKGGIILIFTPNKDSFAFDLMKEKQNLVIPPLHLHYFNIESLSKLFDKYFKVIHFETSGADIADLYAYERDFGDIYD
tara:strand:- start:28 stop:888 length:861 start_codon:yes stop_codon:yes gene_type:complete